MRGRCPEYRTTYQCILIETTVDITTIRVPEQLGVIDELGPWVVSVGEALQESAEEEYFQAKLMAFLEHEGKTLADVKRAVSPVPPASAAPDLNTELVHAISSLVEQCQVESVES